METPKNADVTKKKHGPRKSVGTMKSIEKNKKTLNVPLTGRLAGQKAPHIYSEPELLVRDSSTNPVTKRNLRLKKNTNLLASK